jgi:hypothetical protein
MGPAARDNRGVHPLSIVEWFCPLPELPYVGGLVVPDVCHLARAAAGALPAALREDGQIDSRPATTPVGQAGMEPAEPSPTCGVRALPRACRTVRFTRSIQAVLSRPEKPNPCKAALRAGSVPASLQVRDPYQLAPKVSISSPGRRSDPLLLAT